MNKVPRKNVKQQQTVDSTKRSMLNSNQYSSKTDSGTLIIFTIFFFNCIYSLSKKNKTYI